MSKTTNYKSHTNYTNPNRTSLFREPTQAEFIARQLMPKPRNPLADPKTKSKNNITLRRFSWEA